MRADREAPAKNRKKAGGVTMATSADYSVVLRDLKARRDVLDAAIKALEPVVPTALSVGIIPPPAIADKEGESR